MYEGSQEACVYGLYQSRRFIKAKTNLYEDIYISAACYKYSSLSSAAHVNLFTLFCNSKYFRVRRAAQ